MVFIDQRQLALKKQNLFEILPDNHDGVFEGTQCPRVNVVP